VAVLHRLAEVTMQQFTLIRNTIVQCQKYLSVMVARTVNVISRHLQGSGVLNLNEYSNVVKA